MALVRRVNFAMVWLSDGSGSVGTSACVRENATVGVALERRRHATVRMGNDRENIQKRRSSLLRFGNRCFKAPPLIPIPSPASPLA